jgi:pilus assembly protein CpaC
MWNASYRSLPRRRCAVARRARLAASLLLTAWAAAAAPAVAQTPETNPTIVRPGADGSVARRIELGIGKSFILDLPRDAKEVFVANPRVANAIVRSPRKIFVIGVADGATSVFVLDQEGRQIVTAEIAIGRDMNVLRRLLKTAMPGSQINVVPVGDSIVLTGAVDSASEAAQAVDIAKGFLGVSAVGGGSASTGGAGGTSISIGSSTVVEGKVINSLTVRGRDQVMLKVTVAEVQRAVIKQFGVNANGTWSIGRASLGGNMDNPFPIQLKDTSNSVYSLGGPNGSSINLRAFERAGVLRTLAEPTLTAISGESAKFTAGGEVPIPKSESCQLITGTNVQSCTIGVEYKPFGVALVFQPVVLSSGRISMRVATEVTEIDSENQLKFTTSVVPAFRVRKSDTTIELPSGASLVTAGLIQHSQRQIINGVPALMNLPVLGALFRSRDYQKQETELMIIVTPFIAKPSNSSDLARPDENYVEAKDPQTVIMGRLNKIYGVAGAPTDGRRYRGHVGFIAD